jgi:predicted metal-binding membrane protein
LRRGQLPIWGSIAMMIVLAWLYLFHTASPMPGMDMPAMQMSGWGLTTVFLLFLMWAVMMVAMMVPSAVPMIQVFLAVNERRQDSSRQLVPVGVFLLGYLVVWTSFSAAATLAQWGLHKAALLSPMMVATSPVVSGGLLLVAGIFQWTPLKRSCLRGCRSPLSFLMGEWRDGTAGSFSMGLRHGAYCVGCCWALMALLFVVGVMNLLWVAAIALFVMGEKILPRGEVIGHIAGVALVAAGIGVITKFW